MEYIAHLKENGETQLLEDHLKQTAELAASFGKNIGLEEAAYAAGMLHDDGKFQDAFQKYIRGEYRGRVDHSTAGAVLAILKNYSEAMTAMAPFCIAGHHAGLPDFGSVADPEGGRTLCARLKKGMANRRDYEACGAKAALPEKADVPMYEKIKGDKLGEMLLTRMLFSCLVDADFLDTESFMAEEPVRRGGFHTIEELHDRFFRELEEKGYFSPRNRINEKRCEILKRCVETGSSDPGLYSLTVPTGGGKTVPSLAFAMEQAVKQHKKRIIYVIPYLSIIEQTAGVSRWIGFWTFRQPRRFGLEDRGIGTPSASAGKSAISFSSIPAIWMEIGPEGGSLKRYSKKRPPIEMRLSKFNRVEYRGGNRSMLAVKAVNNSYLLYKINSRYGF